MPNSWQPKGFIVDSKPWSENNGRTYPLICCFCTLLLFAHTALLNGMQWQSDPISGPLSLTAFMDWIPTIVIFYSFHLHSHSNARQYKPTFTITQCNKQCDAMHANNVVGFNSSFSVISLLFSSLSVQIVWVLSLGTRFCVLKMCASL